MKLQFKVSVIQYDCIVFTQPDLLAGKSISQSLYLYVCVCVCLGPKAPRRVSTFNKITSHSLQDHILYTIMTCFPEGKPSQEKIGFCQGFFRRWVCSPKLNLFEELFGSVYVWTFSRVCLIPNLLRNFSAQVWAFFRKRGGGLL